MALISSIKPDVIEITHIIIIKHIFYLHYHVPNHMSMSMYL